MRILVLGADGYLGWPTAMHFSARGHEVLAVDSLLKRRLQRDMGQEPLTPIGGSLAERAQAWQEVTGRTIHVIEGDLCDWEVVARAFRDLRPEAIVHYGQIPSAPYSMRGRAEAVFTQTNNVVNNLHVLFAMLEFAPDAHLVKLGTMGEYGQPDIDIEEGYIEIRHKGRSDVLPFPKLPGSLYHLSKVHDSHNIHFACRVWNLRATDLNQGVVYGIQTPETALDDRLLTRFEYDEIWGTALNRFCLQAVIGHPLTVYGSGGQTRGYLNLVDTLRCVELAVQNPAAAGEFRVFNQFTEQFSVQELADLVQRAGGDVGLDVRIDHVANPRVEKEEHYYNAVHTRLVDLGLEPHPLSETLVGSMFAEIERFRDRVDPAHIMPATRWRP